MNAHQKKNQFENSNRQSRPIFSLRTHAQIGIGIPDRQTSANAPQWVYVMDEILKDYKTENHCFSAIRELQRSRLMPRMGSAARPLKARDFQLYRRNKKLGYRKWQWIQSTAQGVRESTGYDSVWGYGYYTDNGFVIVNKNDEIEFTVIFPMKG